MTKKHLKPRGQVKTLLVALGEIQDLAGKAKAAYWDDRQTDRAKVLVPLLEQIFNRCLAERNRYDVVDED